MTLIQRLNPLNKEEEKKKFFFDPNYNPQFEYSDTILPEELHYYTPVGDTYLAIAQKVLDHITKVYGSHEDYLEQTREEILSREEVEKTVREYLVREKIDKLVVVKFSSQAVARTSMFMNTLTIREPVMYSETGLLGMLNHDVGTHLFRTINDRRQVWHGKRESFHLSPYMVTEEGLAVLHAYLLKEDTLLRRQALYYFSVWFANSHSFSELNTALKKYVPDRERRWEFCLRAKRGIKDTSQPGAFSKDQTYFAGVVEVWRWLKKRDFHTHELYIGKVAMEDIDTLKAIANKEELILPSFVTKHPEKYKEKLLQIGRDNFFDKTP